MKYYLIIFTLILCKCLFAQNFVKGILQEESLNNSIKPIIGANIIWLNSSIGTTSDTNGNFQLQRQANHNKLVISHTAYKTDTVLVNSTTDFITIKLKVKIYETKNIEVSAEKPSTETDFFGTHNTIKITQKELLKAACCNLSESFETNAAVDVSFTDAITGVKQIEMLGLSGIYTQTSMENLPFLRGLLSNVGLTFIPGTWINSINVSKGLGSVANGYEAITGQIDVDLLKPFSDEQKPLSLNIYGDYDQRFEGNLQYRLNLNDNLASMNMIHFSSRKHKLDLNSDNFADMPTFDFMNLMQRWQYHSSWGWESQLGIQYVNDNKTGGTFTHDNSTTELSEKSFHYENKNRFISIFTKNGYVFPDESGKTFGIQMTYNNFSNSSMFGMRDYSGKQESFYFNFLYQSFFEKDIHNFRTGISFIYDSFDETFSKENFKRIEKVPGFFFEYTYSPDYQLSIVAGIRADYHNYFGLMLTPRLHIRYSPDEDWVFRGVIGKGFKTSNILSENSSAFVSKRELKINKVNEFGFGLGQEKAWIFGASITHYFIFNYQVATISLDFYRTSFLSVVIPDFDSNPQKASFSSIENGSYSNSFQAEINIKPVVFLDLRLSYRYLDVKQLINNERLLRPFTSQNRALFNVGLTAFNSTETGNKLLFDFTINLYGEKRIPSTITNPAEYQSRKWSPGFALLNAQVSYSFFEGFDFYLGGENLLDFKQDNPIISGDNPGSKYFDGSLIWGPINGRMVYTGLRFKI